MMGLSHLESLPVRPLSQSSWLDGMSRVLRSLLPARYAGSSSPERPDASQYTAISVGDEAGPDPLLEHARRHGRGVYWCFWVLGAGILLSWNGGSGRAS